MRRLSDVWGLARILWIVVWLSLVVVSCQVSDDRGEEVGTWVLESISVGDEQLDVAGLSTSSMPGIAFWIRFDSNGVVTGEGSCNEFRGSFKREEGRLRVRDVMASAVACETDQKVEEAVLGLLWDDSLALVFLDGSERMQLSDATSVATFVNR